MTDESEYESPEHVASVHMVRTKINKMTVRYDSRDRFAPVANLYIDKSALAETLLKLDSDQSSAIVDEERWPTCLNISVHLDLSHLPAERTHLRGDHE